LGKIAEAPLAPLKVKNEVVKKTLIFQEGKEPVEPVLELLKGEVGSIQPERGGPCRE
jgi:hypothetical protein